MLSAKENEVGSTNISTYSYGVNGIGQRTQVSKTGTAFGSTRDITWGYDAKGQVTKADSTVAGLDRVYQYDLIGNRLKSADSLTLPGTNNYTPNALNQYTAINALTPTHDSDGNMTSGPLPANLSANSTLVWDGENRLVQAQVSGGNTVTYQYDAQSRRVVESVGSATTVTVYDGWNPIAEYGASYALTKTYVWGTDLSGSMQGAGGVGGLLSVTDSTGSYYPTYDGNGNVSEYIDYTGAIVAHYEYDPFGRTTVATGTRANDFAHRFSTKPLDATTGLYYYGYRFYDPETGRWPARDPIEEEGGMNLYGFVGNDGIIRWDYLGLDVVGDEITHDYFSRAGLRLLNFASTVTNFWARNDNVDYTYSSSDDYVPNISSVISGMDELYKKICREKHAGNGGWETIKINGLHEQTLTTVSSRKDYPTSKFWLGTSGSGTGAISGTFECCNFNGVVINVRNIYVNWLWEDTIDARYGNGAGFSPEENFIWLLEQGPINDVPFDITVDFTDKRP